MSAPLNVLLIAEESAGIQLLRKLAKSPHRVSVLASATKRVLSGASVWSVATEMGLEPRPAKLAKDPAFAETVRAEEIDLILCVRSPYIVHGDVLDAARLGGYNLHTGPLPEYAGRNVVSWAIYNGETEHGFTVHKMVAEVDAGAIAFLDRFPIGADEGAAAVLGRCVRAGIRRMQELIAMAAEDPSSIPALAQDATQRRYYGREIPQEGRVDWNRPARDVVNFVRACDFGPFPSPWGRPLATLSDGREIALTGAALTGAACSELPGTLGSAEGDQYRVACSDEWILVQA